MVNRNTLTGLAIAAWLAQSPAFALPVPAAVLAQIAPMTVTGQLSEASETFNDGSYFEIHAFQGQAGDRVLIEMQSDEFDTYFILAGPNDEGVAHDDDGGFGTNSRLALTLPTSGRYQILASSFRVGETGFYTLSWQPTTAAVVARSDTTDAALQQSAEFNLAADGLAQAGRYDEAEAQYRQAIEILKQQLGEQHVDVAINLNNLALFYFNQDRYDEAEPLYQEALGILRAQLGNLHPNVATGINNLALLYQSQGRYGEVEPLYLEALDIKRTLLGAEHLDVALSLNNLATLYYDQGRYDEAELFFLDALAIRQQQLAATHPDIAVSLNNLASLYDDQGRYGEAERLFLEVLALTQNRFGNRHPEVASILNNLASLYYAQGRDEEAESHFVDALTIQREQLGDNSLDVAITLNNLATLYQAQDRYDEAEPLLQEALTIFRGQLGGQHVTVATSLFSLSFLYREQGRYEDAEALSTESLAIFREQFGEAHPGVANNLSNLAFLYQTQGRYGDAEALYRDALTIRQTYLGMHHPHTAISFNNLSVLYQQQGELAQAIATLETGLNIEETNLDLNLSTLADEQRQAYVATLAETTDRAISLNLQDAPESPAATQIALTTVLRRKGRILDAGTNSLQSLRQNLSAVDQAVLDELTTTRQQLATLTFNPPSLPNPTQYQAELTRLETTANQLEGQLARRSAAFRTETQPVELAAVQAQLSPDSVLVEYIRYQPLDTTHPQNPWGADRYAAYLLFPNGDIQAVDLGDAAAIDAATQAFLRLLQDPSATLRAGARPVRRPENVAAISQTLKTLILDPIAPYLQSTDHLLISPDSQLNRLPFEALQAETGGPFLIEQYQISYLNSGRDLLKFNVTEPSQAPAVVLANPDYDSASNSPLPSLGEGTGPALSEVVGVRALGAGERASGQRSANLSQLQVGPLPGTAAEAEAIQSLLPNATIWTEGQATENALKQVQAPRILHIATHGFFLANVERPQSAGSRGLGIQPFSSALTPSTSAASLTENPLLRSGLALAGFNPRRSGDEDGVLTALEASALNLLGTQLVVLSACDTGLGDIANGEGVYGLRRAFAMAGAETQLMSLWQVDDFGTQSLMGQYYEQLLSGKGRAEALREVQLAMINSGTSYAHPYYWAAFIVTGDWLPLE